MLTGPIPVAQPTAADAGLRPAVFYRCTSYFELDGTERAQLLDCDVLPSVEDTYKRLRRAAAGISQALSRSVDAELRAWLRNREAPQDLARILEAGGVYMLELCSPSTRMVLAAHRVHALPLLTRRYARCPALILRGRNLWTEMRDTHDNAPTGYS